MTENERAHMNTNEEIENADRAEVMKTLDESAIEVAATLGMAKAEVADAFTRVINPIPPMLSKKAQGESALTKEQIDALMEQRRHSQLLAGMNRNRRRAYLSGRRAGLSEDMAIQAIRTRR